MIVFFDCLAEHLFKPGFADESRSHTDLCRSRGLRELSPRRRKPARDAVHGQRPHEDHFGLPLFRRGRSGVELTAAGHQFRRYALNLQHFWKQAYQAVTLPRGYRAVFSLAAQVSLWDRLILPWIPWMRAEAPIV
jgi:hypothetical protein